MTEEEKNAALQDSGKPNKQEVIALRHAARKEVLALLYEASFCEGDYSGQLELAKQVRGIVSQSSFDDASAESPDADRLSAENAQADGAPESAPETADKRSIVPDPANERESYINTTYLGVTSHLDELDDVISAYAVGWSAGRIGRVTKSILRLAVYEMLFARQAYTIVINEAVELAKEFDADKTPGFVNGVLNRIAEEKNLKKTANKRKPKKDE